MSALSPYSGPARLRPALSGPKPQAPIGWLAAVAAAFQRMLVRRVKNALSERDARLAIDALKSWDDHMLRDIGLERMDIEAAVRGRFKPKPRLGEPSSGPPPHPYY